MTLVFLKIPPPPVQPTHVSTYSLPDPSSVDPGFHSMFDELKAFYSEIKKEVSDQEKKIGELKLLMLRLRI